MGAFMNGVEGQATLGRWLDSCKVYADRRVLSLLFFGFASGLPLALTIGTLFMWLAEVGVNKTTIGLFALVGTPYTLKFLWAPLVDRMPIPYLTGWIGRRRGWILFTQLLLMATIAGLGGANPVAQPGLTAFLALSVAFWSATQDIAIDAYRVEILEDRQYGAGAATIVLGYRIGMLVSGAGALYLATYVSWFATYGIMAGFMIVGMVTVLLNPEPSVRKSRESVEQERRIAAYLESRPDLKGNKAKVLAWIYGAVRSPISLAVVGGW